MSIDKKIDELIDSLNANTDALNKVLSARTEVMAAASKLADKTKPAAKDDEDKPAPRGRAAAKDDGDDKPAPRGRAAAKDDGDKITLDDIKAGFSKFLSVDDDDERADRATAVRRLTKHLGVAKVTEAKPKDFAKLMGWLGDLKKGNKPDLSEDGDSGKDEEGLV